MTRISNDRLIELAEQYCCLDSETSHIVHLIRTLRKFEQRETFDEIGRPWRRSPAMTQAVEELDNVLSAILIREGGEGGNFLRMNFLPDCCHHF